MKQAQLCATLWTSGLDMHAAAVPTHCVVYCLQRGCTSQVAVLAILLTSLYMELSKCTRSAGGEVMGLNTEVERSRVGLPAAATRGLCTQNL